MEYEKQIEIKLEGNNCIINFPKEQNVSQQNNSLTNIDDISFSVSATSEEDLNSKNSIYNCCKDNNASNSKQCLYSNEKSKLEITYQSIFNSELKSESSNIKTPLLLLNSKNNLDNLKQQKKDSVVKRLDFNINSNNKENNNNSNDSNIRLVKENKYNINSEIPNINIRKLPLIKNNIIKKISKNLNKEYFIHEKIYSSNKNIQRIILDKKIKENSLKNTNMNCQQNKNKTQIIDNINNILNNESFNNNNYQITENFIAKGNLNFITNKISNNNASIILNRCSSKPNLSNMRQKLNNILKLNSKEKENTVIQKEKLKNNALKELDIMPKIMCYENINNNNNNIKINKLKKNPILYPSLTSGNNNTNLNIFNSFNKSANNNNKMKSFNINENSNLKTPLILNKQIILSTPKTNSYSCSTSYSAKNNKIQNDINMSSEIKNIVKEKDPILVKMEAHNSLLKNFFMNKNNYKTTDNKENISNNLSNNFNINNNDEYRFFVNKFNNTSEKNYGNNIINKSININNYKEFRLRKFNTDCKLSTNKPKKIGLLTERNIKNNNLNTNFLNDNKYANNMNDFQKLIKKNEYNYNFFNSINK